jgi:hypothetical protein
LGEGGGQVWMTGTEAGLFKDVGSAVTRFELRDGIFNQCS